MDDPKSNGTVTYIVLLNWNGWQDTVECLESLLQMTRRDFTIIIVDNGSTDGSYERLREWTMEAGNTAGEWVAGAIKRRFVIEWTPQNATAELQPEAQIVLIQAGGNLGFAGGCNVGLRYGLARGDAEYFWLLNNDTVVDSSSLDWQIRKMELRPDLGIVGSTLIFYDEPNLLQCCAGYGFNFWSARVRPASEATTVEALPSEAEVEKRLCYVSGASMFVRQSFLMDVGLLSEQYFLYFEEIDWSTRAQGRYALGYCSQSRVRHKEGKSIGSSRQKKKRSLFSERYLSRNRILFTRTYYPLRLPVTMLWTSCVALSRLVQGDAAQAWTVFAGTWSGLFAQGRRPERVGPPKIGQE